MQSKGCKPDSVTYGGLILAYEKGAQWRRALAALDQMKSNNCRPDSVVYNTVVGVLWNTGVVWAQAKAVQVHRHAILVASRVFSAARLDWWYNRLVQMGFDERCAFNSRLQTATQLLQQNDNKLATLRSNDQAHHHHAVLSRSLMLSA